MLPPNLPARYRAEITRLTLALSTELRPFDQRDTQDRAFLPAMNLWPSSAAGRPRSS
jgi:hypothetical protein